MKRLLGGLILSIAASLAQAQSGTGRLEGVVKDSGGSGVAGAVITVSGPSARVVQSTGGGAFAIGDLPPGSYTVNVSHPGFAPSVKTVDLKAGQTARLSIILLVSRAETMVVTATRAEMRLADAPATVTVLDSTQLQLEPSPTWADILRSVPGVNAVQTSARDTVVTTREASSFFAGSQMALVDGRPLYFDFFNIVFWDLASVGVRDLDQVEVLRGPASVMWGANAATGVVNLITKSPRQSPGLEADLVGGPFSRPRGDEANGWVWGIDSRWAGPLSDSVWARLSAGYSGSDAFARPTGTVPLTTVPLDRSVTVGGGSYDAVRYSNQGTEQPRVDARVDQDVADGIEVTYSAGYAGTQGIFQTPIGPFQLEPGAGLTYGRATYTAGGLRVSGFANYMKAEAPNLLTDSPDGQPLRIDFSNGQYDLDTDYTKLAGRHLLGAGANIRYNTFDISLAPDARHRVDMAGWLQDDIDLDPFRVALALRVDKPENVANALPSPRLAVAWSPAKNQVIRASYNRGYRIPSAIENYLNVSLIGGYFPLGLIDPSLAGQQFPIVATTLGNPHLRPESLDAWELSWQGTFGRTQVGLNVYLDDSHDVISSNSSFAALMDAGIQPFYTSSNPPPGWPLPPSVLDLLAAQGIYIQRESMYLNLGSIRNQGAELSLVQQFSRNASAFLNYSYEAQPQLRNALGDPLRPVPENVGVPPRHRLNFGGSYGGEQFFGSLFFNYADRAYWGDSSNPAYYGFTPSYFLVNAVLGKRWANGRFTTSLRGTNLLGKGIQQTIFGDVLGRAIVFDLGLHFE